jgi:hypothetical protein
MGALIHGFVRSFYSPSGVVTDVVPAADLGRWVRTHLAPLRPASAVDFRVSARDLDRGLTFPSVLLGVLISPLVANSLEAVEGKRRPRLRVRVSLRALPNRPGLVIRVSDTGPGWAVGPDVIEAALTTAAPYSSKGPGRGRGLQTVSQIVRRLDGALRLATGPRAAAVVELTVPWAS